MWGNWGRREIQTLESNITNLSKQNTSCLHMFQALLDSINVLQDMLHTSQTFEGRGHPGVPRGAPGAENMTQMKRKTKLGGAGKKRAQKTSFKPTPTRPHPHPHPKHRQRARVVHPNPHPHRHPQRHLHPHPASGICTTREKVTTPLGQVSEIPQASTYVDT